ncbi:uncharacterized protein fs(1)Ya isoform X2 [Diabrotica undecimpunctata]|uniref:uncharacterized protein fs(1)Ya isoform X2 n=1 Tax=Diabrotica undecimpunctata TaxID=50387 RepID=UPI003B632AE7
MKDFINNNCRLCKKVFCCKTCRENHETEVHKVFPDCDICIFGQTRISSTSQVVLEHIKTDHWPLNCLLCKRLFGSIEELFQHIKCPLVNNSQNSLYTPYNSGISENAYSPYIPGKLNHANNKVNILTNLATSTPMQRDQANVVLEKIQEVIITPVDCSANKNGDTVEYNSVNLKRKVTFCDTPITESLSKKLKNSSAFEGRVICTQFFTAVGLSGGSAYFSATENQSGSMEEDVKSEKKAVVLYQQKDKEEKEKSSLDQANIVIHKEKKVVWISTTELCSSFEEESSLDFHLSNNQFFTPMVPKKKINLVAPCSIVKNKEMSIRFEGPVQISSTPNNSIIPIKSAPNIRDIFHNRPSTSKGDSGNWNSADIHSDDKFCFTESKEDDISLDNSMPGRLWSSVTKLVKNVLHGLSTTLGDTSSPGSLKRFNSDQDLDELPNAKRYKVTDVRCRNTIRDMTPINKYMQGYRQQRSRELKIKIANSMTIKTFADKATQTEETIFTNQHTKEEDTC